MFRVELELDLCREVDRKVFKMTQDKNFTGPINPSTQFRLIHNHNLYHLFFLPTLFRPPGSFSSSFLLINPPSPHQHFALNTVGTNDKVTILVLSIGTRLPCTYNITHWPQKKMWGESKDGTTC